MIDWTMTALAIGAPIAYVVIASFVWALVPVRWQSGGDEPAGLFAAVFWPVFFVCLFAWSLFLIGPRTVAWYRRPKLPKAQVRR